MSKNLPSDFPTIEGSIFQSIALNFRSFPRSIGLRGSQIFDFFYSHYSKFSVSNFSSMIPECKGLTQNGEQG
jgi:hypothetical protein